MTVLAATASMSRFATLPQPREEGLIHDPAGFIPDDSGKRAGAPPFAPTPSGLSWPAPVKVALNLTAGVGAAALARLTLSALVGPGYVAAWGAALAGWTGICYAREALFGARSDGTLVPCNTVMRRMMPFVMPRRSDAWVLYKGDYDLSQTLPFIKTWNKNHDSDRHITLTHVMMGAFLWANQLHPGLNRFVKNNRLFTRNELSIAFTVKSERKEHASLRTAKFRAVVGETFEDMVLRLNQTIHGERASRGRNASEREMSFFLNLPGPILAFAIKLQGILDDQGMWPAALIESDPLYASIFLSNLGSLDATEMPDVAHHLYEFGTVSLFAAACSAQENAGKPSVRINWTYDERVGDAHLCLNVLKAGKDYMENPEKLFVPVTAERLSQAYAGDLRAALEAVTTEARR